MKTSTTKRALFTSIVSMLLCVSMLLGTTYAWFTDSVTSGTNKIVAGNLDIEVLHTNKTVENQKIDAATDLFKDVILWEPGAIAYETFTVKNLGTLALKYKLSLNITDYNAVISTGKTLKNVLKAKVLTGDDMLETVTRDTVTALDWSTTDTLDVFNTAGNLAAAEDDVFQVIVYWKPTANDDDYNLKNGTLSTDGQPLFIDFGISVVASQLNSESDSFDSNYDRDIVLPDLPVSINKTFKSAPITNKAIITDTVEVKNTSTDTGVATMPKAAVEKVVDTLTNQITDKKANTDVSTVIYLDVTTTAKTETAVTYSIDLSAVMTYTDVNDQQKTATLTTLDGNMDDRIITAEMFIGKGLANVTVKHNDTPMTALATAATEEEGFFYNKDSGVLTIKSKSFSPFTVDFDYAAEAAIGNTPYATLKEALEAAKSGDTVTLVNSVDFTEYAANACHVFNLDGVTVDLAGNTIYSNNFGVVYQGDNMTVKNGNMVAVKGGSYAVFGGDTRTTTGVVLEDLTCTGGINLYNTTATLRNCNVTGTNYYAVWADENAYVTIESGSYTAVGNPSILSAAANAGITVKGGTFSADPTAYLADGYVTFLKDNNYTVMETWALYAAESFGTPVDTTNKVVTVASAAELALFAKSINNYQNYTVKLSADIDLGGKVWTPMASWNGTFDGQSHTVSNLYVNANNAYGNGFFSYFGNSGTAVMKNITFDNALVQCGNGQYAGNVYGVIAGYAAYYGNVYFEGVTVKNSTVWAFGKVGGFFGMAEMQGGTASFKDCKVEDLTVKSGYNGGGYAGLIQYAVSGDRNTVIFDNCAEPTVTFVTCGIMRDSAASVKVGTLDGFYTVWDSEYYYADTAKYYNLYASPEADRANVDAIVYNDAHNVEGTTWVDHAADAFSVINTEKKTITVMSAAELALVSKNAKSLTGYTVTLGADIDLAAYEWDPINTTYNTPFVFDGDDHTISNLHVNTTKSDIGLFGNATGATIKNVKIDNVNIIACQRVGAICGQMISGSIDNCTVTNAVITAAPVWDGAENNASYAGGAKAGAIAGYLSNQNTAPATNCTVDTVTVTAYRDAGGLVGYAQGAVDLTGASVKNTTVTLVSVAPYEVNDGAAPSANVGEIYGRFDAANKPVTTNCAVNNVTVTPEPVN